MKAANHDKRMGFADERFWGKPPSFVILYSQFEWFDKLVLAKKRVAPEATKDTPTGLLDHKVLETALARIRRRAR